MRMRTSCPRARRARGRAPVTSPSPPVLAKGEASEATRRMRRRGGMSRSSGVFFENREDELRDMRGDALEVGQHVEVDLGRLQRLREPLAQPREVRGAQLALALAYGRALIEHLLGEGPVVGREARDAALEILGDHAVELEELRLARLGEAPALVELLAGQLHQVLVDDVADVLEVADEGDEGDLLAGEIGRHGLLSQAREEELDLPLEIVELVIAPLHVLQQLLVVR